MRRNILLLALLCAIRMLSPAAATAVTIDTVVVGNAGNVADTVVMYPDNTTGYGSVGYAYRIGTTEVTNAQYAAFLNAKAKSDPQKLYSTSMGSGFGGITRTGTSPNFSYSPIAGRENMPVNYVNWYNAIRFANWLNNGQATGDTETGTYTLGAVSNGIPTQGGNIKRNAGSTWFLASENEWYKAAYYDPAIASYFQYATSSNTLPVTSAPTALPNHVNYANVVGDLTNVGAYTGTTSPYGEFDMNGNAWEWNEGLYSGSITSPNRGVRGSGFVSINTTGVDMLSSWRGADPATFSVSSIGFRVASVLEPIPGDLSRDGQTNAADIGAMMVALSDLNRYEASQTLTDQQLKAIGNLDSDDAATNADLQVLIDSLANAAAGSSLSVVPEPSAGMLVLVASGVTAILRKRLSATYFYARL